VLGFRCRGSQAYTRFVILTATKHAGGDAKRESAEDVVEVEEPGDEFAAESDPTSEEAAEVEEPPTEVAPPEPEPPASGTPPDTQPPSTPSGLSRTAASTSTISVSWRASTDNVGVKGYSAYRSGTRVANLTATTYKFTGLACGKSYSLAVTAYDAAGNASAKASLTASTAACPPPPKKVALTKGGSAQGKPGCSSSACRYLQVSYSGFSSGSHTITCRASHGDEGGFYTYTRSGASNTSAVCYYGFGGRSVWVTVDGTSSNKITW
jgi:hypothetical protein